MTVKYKVFLDEPEEVWRWFMHEVDGIWHFAYVGDYCEKEDMKIVEGVIVISYNVKEEKK